MDFLMLLVCFGCLSSSAGFAIDTPYLNDHCISKKDGNYTVRDVLKYLECKSERGTIRNCYDSTMFVATRSKCVVPSGINVENFCEDENNGNYRHPWDCHKFIMCVHTKSYVYACPSNLVYNPDKDECDFPGEYKCTQLPAIKARSKQVAKFIDDIEYKFPDCSVLADGNYSISDVFKYVTCKEGTKSLNTCPVHSIFEPGAHKCVDISTQTEEGFCQDHANGDWLNPWNCHTFFKCLNSVSYKLDCQLKELVFNPYSDQCVYPSKYPCHQIEEHQSIHTAEKDGLDANPCAKLHDGNYTQADVFKYLTCKGGKATYHKCPQNDIFDPSKKTCLSIDTQTITSFCKDRPDGDWMNPWNCNTYLRCSVSVTRQHACLINGFVFNPELDVCVQPGEYPCEQARSENNAVIQPIKEIVSSIKLDEPAIKDICTTLPDGNYATRNVFQILQCQSHKSHVYDCLPNTIYIPGQNNCTDASKIKKDNFCDHRSEGNWQNPWDCHSYLTCHNGAIATQICNHFVTLNYDPAMDTCEYPSEMVCKQLSTLASAASNYRTLDDTKGKDKSCKSLPDGRYPIRDVFQYRKCKKHRASYRKCADGQFYSTLKKKCINGKGFKKDTFCIGRTVGDWRDPWNCHGYISCVPGSFAIPRVCSKYTVLNYDPNENICEYPAMFPCKQIADSSHVIFSDDSITV